MHAAAVFVTMNELNSDFLPSLSDQNFLLLCYGNSEMPYSPHSGLCVHQSSSFIFYCTSGAQHSKLSFIHRVATLACIEWDV